MKKSIVSTLLFALFITISSTVFAGSYTFEQKTGTAKSADDSTIAYTSYTPNMPTLVFVHGWSCDQTYWKEQIKFFASRYPVVTIDLATHGLSSSTRKNCTVEAFGDDVAAVLEKLDIKRAILIGHSMGGPVIVNAATKQNKRVIGVIGVDTLDDLSFVCTQEIADQLTGPLKADFTKGTTAFVKSMFLPSADAQIVEWVSSDMASANPETAMSAMENLFKYDIKTDIVKLNIPVACVNSDLWPTNIKANKTIYPDFSLVIIPQSDHFLMLEKPDEFNRALKFVINRISKS